MDSILNIEPEKFDRIMASFKEIAVLDDCSPEPDDADWDGFCDLDVDDGQPTEYDEWQSFDPDC